MNKAKDIKDYQRAIFFLILDAEDLLEKDVDESVVEEYWKLKERNFELNRLWELSYVEADKTDFVRKRDQKLHNELQKVWEKICKAGLN